MMDLSRRAFIAGGLGTVASTLVLRPAAATTMMPSVRTVRTNGIDLAIHEHGKGPLVVLLHGFPGLAFTWRHQIPTLAAAGYRVVAPDLRGYGLSEAPGAVEDYGIAQLTGDLAGLLDALGEEKAIFVGHDWGGLLAWQMPLLHPERVAGVIGVNTPFVPHWMLWLHRDLVNAVAPERKDFVADPTVDPIAQMRQIYSPEMYVLLFESGRHADDAMAGDPEGALRAAYRKDLMTAAEWGSLPPKVADMRYYGEAPLADPPGRDVLNAEELRFYADRFERTGFTPAINWYRNISANWQAGLETDQTIRVPSLMVSGANDVVLRPSMADGMEAHVPDLERHTVADCWHWTPEEKPDELNVVMTSWLRRRFPSA